MLHLIAARCVDGRLRAGWIGTRGTHDPFYTPICVDQWLNLGRYRAAQNRMIELSTVIGQNRSQLSSNAFNEAEYQVLLQFRHAISHKDRGLV